MSVSHDMEMDVDVEKQAEEISNDSALTKKDALSTSQDRPSSPKKNVSFGVCMKESWMLFYRNSHIVF